jgi:uncharacterized protein (DUF58 family)
MPASNNSRVWALPNGRALGLVAVLAAMCYAGASQGNGAAYLLCFVLTALALVSLVHGWANLHGLLVSVGNVASVFAGEEVAVPVTITGRERGSHFGLQIAGPLGIASTASDRIAAGSPAQVTVFFPSPGRGHYRTIPLHLSSDYPLGFFTARQRVKVSHDFFVYPAPHGSAPFPMALAPTRQSRDGHQHEGDDFGGTRQWRPGESQRHIDWKAAARNPVLLTKQWTGETNEVLYLDWAALPSLEMEARLSQLAKWVITAERGFETYALRLPGRTVRAGHGDRHFHECMRALAGFEAPASHGTE